MKTWILCVNKKGASIHMRRDGESRMHSVDLLYKRTNYIEFLAFEMERLCEESGKNDLLFICAESSVLTSVLNGLGKRARAKVSRTISLDLQSTPSEYIYKFAREMIEKAAG